MHAAAFARAIDTREARLPQQSERREDVENGSLELVVVGAPATSKLHHLLGLSGVGTLPMIETGDDRPALLVIQRANAMPKLLEPPRGRQRLLEVSDRIDPRGA